MQFNNEDLDKVFDAFRDAVAQTGYKLRRVDEDPQAGLIDDQLRVEIRRSKFLIADLSTDNRGAYWEGGFAEGLGLKVFYVCEQEKFEKMRTHFDTEHLMTITWSLSDLADAQRRLKASIRATFPGEAVIEDLGEGET